MVFKLDQDTMYRGVLTSFGKMAERLPTHSSMIIKHNFCVKGVDLFSSTHRKVTVVFKTEMNNHSVDTEIVLIANKSSEDEDLKEGCVTVTWSTDKGVVRTDSFIPLISFEENTVEESILRNVGVRRIAEREVQERNYTALNMYDIVDMIERYCDDCMEYEFSISTGRKGEVKYNLRVGSQNLSSLATEIGCEIKGKPNDKAVMAHIENTFKAVCAWRNLE